MTFMGGSSTLGRQSPLVYRGGPLLANVKVYAVMWGQTVDPTTQSQIGNMLAATVNSTYMDQLSEYSTTQQSIGRGVFGGTGVIQPTILSAVVQDQEIGPELEKQIQAGVLPAPDQNTVYLTYFPAGVTVTLGSAQSCKTFCGYHHSYHSPMYGAIYYGVVADLSGACSYGCGGNANAFDNITIVTSHELSEAVTDPAVEPTGNPGAPDAWNNNQGMEIGDLCNGTATTLSTSSGVSYYVQQEWLNSSRGCSPGPFASSL